MMVMILERVTPGLRGELSRWLLQPKAGVFAFVVSESTGNVVPTRVGVNRATPPPSSSSTCCPHTRGVNRGAFDRTRRTRSCPHTRGGEPTLDEQVRAEIRLSPHAWG